MKCISKKPTSNYKVDFFILQIPKNNSYKSKNDNSNNNKNKNQVVNNSKQKFLSNIFTIKKTIF